ncbi:MAG: bifunctional diguanylate cyclase/phosphodiesterase [Campylobacterota bacterium]|nr:bifunctional diguanylate cyclase/phosphodiesterase [Campylobacterota bacterium]
MKNIVKPCRFILDSDSDMQYIIDEISNLKCHDMIIHIEAVIHNTVFIQSIKKMIEDAFDEPHIGLMKISRDEPTAVTVYCLSEHSEIKTDRIIYELNQRHISAEHKLKMSRQSMIKRYFTDPLTNLPNLYKLRNDMHDSDQGSFIIIHIDNFKLINDFYGFVVGDYILEQSAQYLSSALDGNSVYKISPTEFAIILNDKLDFYELKTYMNTLSLKLQNLFFTYQETKIFIDFTLASSAGTSWDNVFSKVSMALHYAKDNHLSFWIYEDRMHFESEYEKNLELSIVIRNAIESSGIIPYFQPIVCNKTGVIKKYECLSRLINSKNEVLSPDLFIPITKKIKVYHLVTQEIINKSFETFKDSDLSFSINLSIEDVMSQKIYAFIVEKLATSKIGSRVVFELLESESINDYKKVARFINEVKRYGAKIAIDDFGSGFSNFSYLTKLDIDYIKIDGTLIENIDSDKNSELVVKTIVEFAHKLNIKTIAEYVHSSTILSKVKSLGIDYSQGYYIDKPHPQL